MLQVIEHGDVVELRLARPPVNAMDSALLEALLNAQGEAVAAGAGALIVSGREGLFSAGLDVPALLSLERAEVEAFWALFFSTMHCFAKSTVPVIAALTGHAPAGGMVLGLHCDYRIATRGEYLLGLNEVAVGLPVPRTIIYALEMAVGTRQASLMTMEARMLTPAQAYDVGLVDELADEGYAIPAALEKAEAWLQHPSKAFNKTRLAAKSDFIEKTAELSAFTRIATDAWFADETQRSLRALAEKLGK